MTADVSHDLRIPLTFLRGQWKACKMAGTSNAEKHFTFAVELIRLQACERTDDWRWWRTPCHEIEFRTFTVLIWRSISPVSLAMQDREYPSASQ
jgi:signal transduction histidine kinase